MMNRKARHLLLVILLNLAFAIGLRILFRFNSMRRSANQAGDLSTAAGLPTADPNLWARSMEKLKEARSETENVGIDIPTELRHYDDRRWFLGTQVAEGQEIQRAAGAGFCGPRGDDSAR